MSGWQEVTLQDVVTVLGDGLHGTPIYDDNGEYYFVNGNNLSNGKILLKDSTRRASEVEYLKYKKPLNNRTILLSINGTLGNVALYNNEKCFLGKSACYFNIKEDVDKQYIRYVVTNKNFQTYITEFANGTTIQNLSLKTLREFPFELPPLEEQKAIASVLSSLDDKIDLLHRQNTTLERMAETLFRQWFVEEAQEDWGEAKLGAAITISYGKNLPTKNLLDDGYPVFGANGQIGFYDRYTYEEPQVLVSCRGEASGKVNISLPKSYVTNNSLILEQNKRAEISFEFLKYWALQYDFNLHVSGSAQPQITIDGLYGAVLSVPPKELIEKFSLLVREFETKKLNNFYQTQTLEKLRDNLLPKLMSGEVRVDLEGHSYAQ